MICSYLLLILYFSSGHTDCVRALVILSDVAFLSAGNDNVIRRWLTTGECEQQFQAHTSFVYSLALLPNGLDFVSSGEDRTIRVWREGKCHQTLTLPAQSVWCVTVLPNGDIAAGSRFVKLISYRNIEKALYKY